MKLLLALVVTVLGLSAFPKVAFADEIILPLTDDTFLDQNEPNYAFGNGSSLLVSANQNENKIILLKFDLAGIPKDSTIQSASLTMEATGCGGRDESPEMLLSYANDSWSEQTARWTGRPRIGVEVDLIDAYPRTKLFDVTSAVSKWFKGTIANRGVILTIQGGPYECEFRSQERDPDDVQLLVHYQPPLKNLYIPTGTFKVPTITLQNSSSSATSSPAAIATATSTVSPSISPDATPESTAMDASEVESLDKAAEDNDAIVITPRQVIIGLLGVVVILLVTLATLVMSKIRSKNVISPVYVNLSQAPKETSITQKLTSPETKSDPKAPTLEEPPGSIK